MRFVTAILLVALSAISSNVYGQQTTCEEGDASFSSKEYQGAIRAYTNCLRNSVAPDTAKHMMLVFRGLSLARLAQFDRAEADLDLAIETYGGSDGAYYYRGIIRSSTKSFDGAILDFGMAIEIRPDYANAYDQRGNAYYGNKQYHEAIPDFTRAIQLGQTSNGAFTNRGYAYQETGQFPLAIKDFGSELKLNVGNVRALVGRCISYFKTEQYELAIPDCDKGAALKPEWKTAYIYSAEAKRFLGRYREAIADYEEALKFDHSNFQANRGRGLAFNLLRVDAKNKESDSSGSVVDQDDPSGPGLGNPIVISKLGQRTLLKRSPRKQVAYFHELFKSGGFECESADPEFLVPFIEGSGAWYVFCGVGVDYYVTVPAKKKDAATIFSCVLAAATLRADCYVNESRN
jgi:tetratricopeptide (TPR) repeat protein